MTDSMTRADYMTAKQREKMADMARSHINCRIRTEVARPGKTAFERARRSGAVTGNGD